MKPIAVRIAYERASTARALEVHMAALGLAVEAEIDLAKAPPEVGAARIFFLEQRGHGDAFVPRLYSLTRAHPDVLVVMVAAAPREVHESAAFTAGAFDVIDDGPTLASQLRRATVNARRVLALHDERADLGTQLAQQDKLTALGLLAAGVSHEINNPCGAMSANVQILREQLESVMTRPRFQRADALELHAPEWLDALGDCLTASRRIQSVVKTLNVFSRRTDLSELQLVDVNDEINTVLRLVGKEVRFQAEFVVDLAESVPPIMAPPNAVAQILTNLVVNALHSLELVPVGHRRVRIATDADADAVLIEVSDNGPGIPREILGRIFDPFFTTKPMGKGTGLGLAITYELVRRSHGEIFVESDPDEGARFRLVFERASDTVMRSPVRRSVPPTAPRLRVLVLDDDELSLRSIHRSLVSNFECVSCESARGALVKLVEDQHFDAVLSDIVMPEMNGAEFYQQLVQTYPHLAARTVFLSGGVTAPALRAEVLATGRPLLEKPVDVGELVRTLRGMGDVGSRATA